LNIATSDIDIRGVFINSLSDELSLFTNNEQVGDDTNDTVYYSLRKFFKLASDANPNIVELLHMKTHCVKIKTPIWDQVIQNRDLFISKKAYHTFSGYAYAQIKRCRGQNKWINNPQPKERPKKEDFCYGIDLKEYAEGVVSNANCWQRISSPLRPFKMSTMSSLDKMDVAKLEHTNNVYRLYWNGKGVFRDDQLVCESIPVEEEWNRLIGLLIFNEQEYEAKVRDWKNYWEWMGNRNEARWVKQQSGELDYDSKNMMHCIRLLYSGMNILKNGEPLVWFEGEQRQFLLDVREGKFTYDYLIDYAENKMKELEELKNSCTLPESADRKKIDQLYFELVKG
jgi:predicted nucleotidyltransferase